MGKGPQAPARVHHVRGDAGNRPGVDEHKGIRRGEEVVHDALVLLGFARTGGVDQAPARCDVSPPVHDDLRPLVSKRTRLVASPLTLQQCCGIAEADSTELGLEGRRLEIPRPQ